MAPGRPDGPAADGQRPKPRRPVNGEGDHGRKREQALWELLDHLAQERGRLDSPEDEAEIARYMRLLGGVAEESGELRAG